MTNKTGEWTREQLTNPIGRDSEPSIAMDSDGSLWVAFTRWLPDEEDPCAGIMDCFTPAQGLFYVTNTSGAWSPAEPFGPPESNNATLFVRDGTVHLSYLATRTCGELCAPAPIHYRTNGAGEWTDVKVGETWGRPSLAVGADGRARLVFWEVGLADGGNFAQLWFAIAGDEGNGFETEPLFLRERGWFDSSLLALDGSDRPHVFAEEIADDGNTNHYYVGDDSAFVEATPPSSAPVALAADQDGAVHLLVLSDGCCLSYATNRSGTFLERPLWSDYADGALVLDTLERPHILFHTLTHGGPDLWYAVGPGD